jgi:hypothetical protein
MSAQSSACPGWPRTSDAGSRMPLVTTISTRSSPPPVPAVARHPSMPTAHHCVASARLFAQALFTPGLQIPRNIALLGRARSVACRDHFEQEMPRAISSFRPCAAGGACVGPPATPPTSTKRSAHELLRSEVLGSRTDSDRWWAFFTTIGDRPEESSAACGLSTRGRPRTCGRDQSCPSCGLNWPIYRRCSFQRGREDLRESRRFLPRHQGCSSNRSRPRSAHSPFREP